MSELERKPIILNEHEASDLEAAAEQVYVEAVEEVIDQNTGLDTAALVTMGLIVVMFHVLVPELRDNSQLGSAVRLDSLRVVLAVVLGFLSLLMFVGERNPRQRQNSSSRTLTSDPVRLVAGGVLAVYTLYVASFVFMKLDLLTSTFLPTIMEWAALISVAALWRPWERLKLYRKVLWRLAPALIIFVTVIILWEFLINLFQVQQFLLPAPSVIANTFATVYPRTIAQGWTTFQNALWGFAFGCGGGILFGLFSARFVGFSRAMLPYAIAVNSIPIVAFAPITNAWFGVVSPNSKIAIVTILTFFPAMVNTVRGLTSANSSSIELMKSLAASELEIFLKLRLPTALPFIFNALKVATTLSMIGAIVAEYFGGPLTGLGVQISSNATLIRYPLVWSQIVVASMFGILFYFVVSMVERLAMPWHISFRPEAE